MINPLGTKGHLAQSFSMILHEMWQAEMPYLTPIPFRVRSPPKLHRDYSHQIHPRNQYVHMRLNSLDRINMTLKNS